MEKSNRFNQYLAPRVAAGLLLAIGASACGGESLKTSPMAEHAYRGDPTAQGKKPNAWPRVVVAEVNLQEPVTDADLIACFTDPGGNWHRSEALALDPTESTNILFKLGPRAVKFGVVIQAKSGSKLTKYSPATTFEGPELYATALGHFPDAREPDPTGWKRDTNGVCSEK
jgi:hypothetical protein